MSTPGKIPVRLTVEQWAALHRTATGELESLTEYDWKSGAGDDLWSAVEALEDARRKAARKAAA